MRDHILAVPYSSQYLDIKDPHWVIRACGIANVKMALDYFGAHAPTLDKLIEEGVAMGAYGASGWYHDGLIAIAEKRGVEGFREEDMDTAQGLKKIRESLKTNTLVIVSVVQMLLGRKKYHQVLLVGYREESGNIKGLFYHDPAATDRDAGKNLYVDVDVFKVYWRNKAIFLREGKRGR